VSKNNKNFFKRKEGKIEGGSGSVDGIKSRAGRGGEGIKGSIKK